MKALAALVLVVVAVLVWTLRRPSHRTAPATGTAAAATAASGSAVSPSAPAGPVHHATQLTPEQRRQVAERIATAHAAHVAHSAPAAPSLPPIKPTLDPDNLEDFKTTIRGGMREVIPMLTDCYAKAGSSVGRDITVHAHLKLTGDPDIGTLIDADKLTDPHGGAFAPGFDDCIRTTLQTIELPPLAEGDEVLVTYPFVFRQD